MDGALQRLVGATFYDAVAGSGKADFLAFIAYPQAEAALHSRLMPRLQAAAAAMRANGTAQAGFGVIDAEENDVPPPYGAGITRASLVLYPAGAKRTPKYATDMGDGALTLYDILYFIASTAGSRPTAEVAVHLMTALSQEQLYAKPSDDDDGDDDHSLFYAQLPDEDDDEL